MFEEKIFDLETEKWAGQRMQRSWGKSKSYVIKEKGHLCSCIREPLN